MSQILKSHIQRFIHLEENLYPQILSYFKPIQVRKKQNLLSEGSICTSNYFIEKGCLRMFFIKDTGVEQTTEFAIENWWLADYASFASQKPSEFFIQAVENSEVLALDHKAHSALLQNFPPMEKYFRILHQRAHAASQFRIKTLYHLSREEMYRQFSREFPEFVQRIPQYLLASFLGFTPEYLSEIRKKKIS